MVAVKQEFVGIKATTVASRCSNWRLVKEFSTLFCCPYRPQSKSVPKPEALEERE
jgi:hypothetical protein